MVEFKEIEEYQRPLGGEKHLFHTGCSVTIEDLELNKLTKIVNYLEKKTDYSKKKPTQKLFGQINFHVNDSLYSQLIGYLPEYLVKLINPGSVYAELRIIQENVCEVTIYHFEAKKELEKLVSDLENDNIPKHI